MFINDRKKRGESFQKAITHDIKSCIMEGTEVDTRAKSGSGFDQKLKWIHGSKYEGMNKQSKPISKYIIKRQVNHIPTMVSGDEDHHGFVQPSAQ